MNRISSLFVATTLAILPVSAFAQQDAAAAKNAASNSMSSTTPTNTTASTANQVAGGKTATVMTPATTTANVTQPAKSDVKTSASGIKAEVHGMNTVKSHDSKMNVPVTGKTAEPGKS